MPSLLRAAPSAVVPFCLFAVAAMPAPTLAESPVALTPANLLTVAPLQDADPAANRDDGGFTAPVVHDEGDPDEVGASPPAAVSLVALVDAHATPDTLDAEQECLAVSVYFESKGEPLDGQLAVAQTMINRTQSGRFPASVCGVLRQRGQFSFVHAGALPAVPRSSVAWRDAVAIARIARDGLWKAAAPGALFFHAARVSPGWNHVVRVASIGNHIFYR